MEKWLEKESVRSDTAGDSDFSEISVYQFLRYHVLGLDSFENITPLYR